MMNHVLQFPLRDAIAPGPVESVGWLFLDLLEYLIPLVIIGVIVVVVVMLVKRKKAKQASQQQNAASETDHPDSGNADGDRDS